MKQKNQVSSMPELLKQMEKVIGNWYTSRIKHISKETGMTPLSVMAQCLMKAERPILETYRADKMLNSIKAVFSVSCSDGWRRAIGFDKASKLVVCDGNATMPITLQKSAALLAQMERRYEADDKADSEWLPSARLRWLEMVAASIK